MKSQKFRNVGNKILHNILLFKNSHSLLMKIIKYAIFFISIVFIIKVFYINYSQLSQTTLINYPKTVAFIALSSVFYLLLLLSLGKGWSIIVTGLEKKKKANNMLKYIFIKSQLYKYIPGNIFHYAGRHVMASKYNISSAALLKSNILEAINHLIAALFCSLFLYNIVIFRYIPIENIEQYALLVFFIAFILIIYIFRNSNFFKICLRASPYYFLYFIGLGLMSFVVINYIINLDISYFYCLSLYSIAWIAGYIIPGAPGGIGVRETIFIIMSSHIISQPQALVVIIILRLTTTLSELFGYFLSDKILSNHH